MDDETQATLDALSQGKEAWAQYCQDHQARFERRQERLSLLPSTIFNPLVHSHPNQAYSPPYSPSPYAGVRMRSVPVAGKDLSGYDFSGSDCHFDDISGTRFDGATFSCFPQGYVDPTNPPSLNSIHLPRWCFDRAIRVAKEDGHDELHIRFSPWLINLYIQQNPISEELRCAPCFFPDSMVGTDAARVALNVREAERMLVALDAERDRRDKRWAAIQAADALKISRS